MTNPDENWIARAVAHEVIEAKIAAFECGPKIARSRQRLVGSVAQVALAETGRWQQGLAAAAHGIAREHDGASADQQADHHADQGREGQ
jgi:hypothetical protein